MGYKLSISADINHTAFLAARIEGFDLSTVGMEVGASQAEIEGGSTFRKPQYMLSVYSAPLGRPELPEVYMRWRSGSREYPSLPGMAGSGTEPACLPTSSTCTYEPAKMKSIISP